MAQPQVQLMADVSEDQITATRPFEKVSVDFGGPLLVKSSNLHKAAVNKSYMALFVCMVTKSVYVELVSDLSTNDFIPFYKRFISRQGIPSIIFKVTATNILGSYYQLQQIFKFYKNKTNEFSSKLSFLEKFQLEAHIEEEVSGKQP